MNPKPYNLKEAAAAKSSSASVSEPLRASSAGVEATVRDLVILGLPLGWD